MWTSLPSNSISSPLNTGSTPSLEGSIGFPHDAHLSACITSYLSAHSSWILPSDTSWSTPENFPSIFSILSLQTTHFGGSSGTTVISTALSSTGCLASTATPGISTVWSSFKKQHVGIMPQMKTTPMIKKINPTINMAQNPPIDRPPSLQSSEEQSSPLLDIVLAHFVASKFFVQPSST